MPHSQCILRSYIYAKISPLLYSSSPVYIPQVHLSTVLVFPMFHVGGAILSTYFLAYGHTAVLPKRFQPGKLFLAIQEMKVQFNIVCVTYNSVRMCAHSCAFCGICRGIAGVWNSRKLYIYIYIMYMKPTLYIRLARLCTTLCTL